MFKRCHLYISRRQHGDVLMMSPVCSIRFIYLGVERRLQVTSSSVLFETAGVLTQGQVMGLESCSWKCKVAVHLLESKGSDLGASLNRMNKKTNRCCLQRHTHTTHTHRAHTHTHTHTKPLNVFSMAMSKY